MRVAQLRQPFLRPAGLPDCPLTNGRPRGRYCGFCGTISDIDPLPELPLIGAPWRYINRNCGDFSVAAYAIIATLRAKIRLAARGSAVPHVAYNWTRLKQAVQLSLVMSMRRDDENDKLSAAHNFSETK